MPWKYLAYIFSPSLANLELHSMPYNSLTHIGSWHLVALENSWHVFGCPGIPWHGLRLNLFDINYSQLREK